MKGTFSWKDRDAQIAHCRRICKLSKGTRNLGRCSPGLIATGRPTVFNIVWAAGVYEGEGYCNWNGGSSIVQISQKDIWLLQKLQTLFGGSIKPINQNKHWHWRISGARSRGFLMTIYQFLSPRRKQQVRKALNKREGV